MSPFCTDIDLIHWEPNICRDAAFASQTLITGTADLSGTTLTIASGSFIDRHVEPNQVIVLSGSISGSFPILTINSATDLTISILYDGLFSGEPTASAVGAATGLTFAIRTFWPQRQMVTEILTQAVGIIPDDPRTANATILNPEALRRPCIFGTLQLIYSALSAVADAPKEYAVRATVYQRLCQRAMRLTQVDLDLNGDGQADHTRQLNSIELVRR